VLFKMAFLPIRTILQPTQMNTAPLVLPGSDIRLKN